MSSFKKYPVWPARKTEKENESRVNIVLAAPRYRESSGALQQERMEGKTGTGDKAATVQPAVEGNLKKKAKWNYRIKQIKPLISAHAKWERRFTLRSHSTHIFCRINFFPLSIEARSFYFYCFDPIRHFGASESQEFAYSPMCKEIQGLRN